MDAITPSQCRAARAFLGLGQGELAAKSDVAQKTIADFELGNRAPRKDTLKRIRAALERAGVEFIPENGGGVGVRLRKPKKGKR